MEDGISIDEACAKNVVGTQEDFERNCNPDGTVKGQPETTTFTLGNNDTQSITLNNTYLYMGIAGVLILASVVIVVIVRKVRKRKITKQ